MSNRRVERLLNLTMCLMSTREYLTLWEIGEKVGGYDPGSSKVEREAFRRMFERDKEDLRDLGVPVETGHNTSFEDEAGYRISPRDYALPDLHLDGEELAALALANRLWVSASLAGAGATALHKLEATGSATASPPEDLLPRIESQDPSFEPLCQAVRDRRRVRFRYLKSGAAQETQRVVEPWGVVSWHGHWYLAGRDTRHEGMRVFRLSRIRGAVAPAGAAGSVHRPPDLDVRAEVVRRAEQMAVGEGAERVARLHVRAGAGHALRRSARSVEPAGRGPDVVEVPFTDLHRMAGQVLWHGADVVVLEPDDLRAEVVRRLRAHAGHGVA